MPSKRSMMVFPGTLDGNAAPAKGIDRRSLQSAADPASAYDALNVDLDTGGGYKRRDGLLEFGELPPNTHGLYSLGGSLRVAVPSGYGYQTSMPTGIRADAFGDSISTPVAPTKYVRMTANSSWGADTLYGALPYFVLETDSGQYIHHWITTFPAGVFDSVDTRIDTGFEAGPDLTKIQRKLYAPDVTKKVVRYSSTQFGPGTWKEADAPNDAGFLNVNEHALGAADVQGLTTHQGRLVVVFSNSMQFWNPDPDPAKITFNTALNGPGTTVFGSLAPVIGDIFYFSEGGFRSLQTQTVTGELREGDLGAAITELTLAFNNTDPLNVHSLWSQARSQYICIFNTGSISQAFCFTLSPSMGIVGWTRWELPIAVDYMTELDGTLYVRRENMVYKLDPDTVFDQVNGENLDVPAYIDSHFCDSGQPRWLKQWTTMDVMSDSTIDISVYLDQRNRSLIEPVAVDVEGTTYDEGMIPVDVVSHAVAFRFTLKDTGSFERAHIDSIVLVGSG